MKKKNDHRGRFRGIVGQPNGSPVREEPKKKKKSWSIKFFYVLGRESSLNFGRQTLVYPLLYPPVPRERWRFFFVTEFWPEVNRFENLTTNLSTPNNPDFKTFTYIVCILYVLKKITFPKWLTEIRKVTCGR